jgi:hypothetical protein
MEALDVRKQGRNPVKNGPGTLPVGHMYGVRTKRENTESSG